MVGSIFYNVVQRNLFRKKYFVFSNVISNTKMLLITKGIFDMVGRPEVHRKVIGDHNPLFNHFFSMQLRCKNYKK